MRSTLIVARMEPESASDVARIFTEFDNTEMPHLMGTWRRELFHYHGLYLHLQDFVSDGPRAIEENRRHPLFVGVSAKLQDHIAAYDPSSWRSPADAMAEPFYRWEREPQR